VGRLMECNTLVEKFDRTQRPRARWPAQCDLCASVTAAPGGRARRDGCEPGDGAGPGRKRTRAAGARRFREEPLERSQSARHGELLRDGANNPGYLSSLDLRIESLRVSADEGAISE